MSESGYNGDINNHVPAYANSHSGHRPISPRNHYSNRLVGNQMIMITGKYCVAFSSRKYKEHSRSITSENRNVT